MGWFGFGCWVLGFGKPGIQHMTSKPIGATNPDANTSLQNPKLSALNPNPQVIPKDILVLPLQATSKRLAHTTPSAGLLRPEPVYRALMFRLRVSRPLINEPPPFTCRNMRIPMKTRSFQKALIFDPYDSPY